MKNLKNKAKEKALAKNWFIGGNLHKSTLEEWLKAEYGNGLATSADWVTTFSKMKNSTFKIMDGDDLYLRSVALVQAITESSRNQPDAHYMKTAEVALVAAYALGWLKDK